jgi:isopenicillin N synthase-like dioxygenase
MADTKDHELNADTYPPFPSDAPVAQLETFKFDTLHSDGKSLNGQTLRSACYQHGVFYLDLTDSDPWFSQLPKSAKYLMHRLEPIFDLPQAVKDKFIFADLESKVGGYQRAGASSEREACSAIP